MARPLRSNEDISVLIVDDEPSIRSVLEGLLLPEGYSLAFAENGVEALEKVSELEPDLILLDVMMPGMDGFQVCRHLKSGERWRHIPVIMVTALDSTEDMASGLEAGADDFISKPVKRLELRARVRSLLRIKRQFDELKDNLQMREDLSNMIVHDMRGPLTAIMGLGHLLRLSLGKAGNTRDVEDLEKIEFQARRLNSFANDMLALAKMQGGRMLLNLSLTDLKKLALEIEEGYRHVARSKDIDFALELPEEEGQVSVDTNLFQRVLDNLVSNALKFSPEGGRVVLRVEYPTPGSVRVRVVDEGPGIPEEYRERIFNRFEVIELKRKGIQQVGLGLAFCKMVVDAHGGRIRVEPNEPEGSVFTVEI